MVENLVRLAERPLVIQSRHPEFELVRLLCANIVIPTVRWVSFVFDVGFNLWQAILNIKFLSTWSNDTARPIKKHRQTFFNLSVIWCVHSTIYIPSVVPLSILKACCYSISCFLYQIINMTLGRIWNIHLIISLKL